MKTISQIIIFLSFSIASFAQKIPCKKLLQLPICKYLMYNEEDSVQLVISNLKHCDFDEFERETITLSILIGNVLTKKREEGTVQDLYDEVLLFRQSDEYAAAKALAERQRTFEQKYLSKKVTKKNWTKGSALLCEYFGFDNVELEAFTNPLFEEQGKRLDLTYAYLLQDFHTYINNKYHLSNAVKRDSTDFDFGDNSYPFPSMNYYERTKIKDATKPTLIYFYGYGAINCNKLNDDAFRNPNLFKLVDSSFNFITLPIDARDKMPQELKEKLEKEYSGKRFRSAGNYNVFLQATLFEAQTQPFFVVVNQDEKVLATFDYRAIKATNQFVQDLEKILEE